MTGSCVAPAGLTSRPAGEGFTLIEVMVALTILSLVMLATVSGFRTLAQTQTTLDRTINRVDEIRTVSAFLRQLFESGIVSESGSEIGLSLGGAGGGDSEAFFDMNPSGIVLKSIVLMGEGFGGTQVVRVAREGSAIILRWSQEELKAKDERWQRYPSRELVRGVEEFVVSSRTKSDAPWKPEWEGYGVPESIRVVLKAHGRFFPELIIPVQR